MSSENSISQYIERLKQGDSDAADQVWNRYVRRLIQFAKNRFTTRRKSVADEEDVVQQAFCDFFQMVKEDRFSRLEDRNDLWQVLAMLVDRRAKDILRHQYSQKTGEGLVRTESVFQTSPHDSNSPGIASLEDLLPTPETAAVFWELFENRLSLLNDPNLREVALLKMQGHTNREIADLQQTSQRTIERALYSIRKRWTIAETDR
jgi:RNA polymerase sigma factor (sigma-70 family)